MTHCNNAIILNYWKVEFKLKSQPKTIKKSTFSQPKVNITVKMQKQ